MYGEDINNLPFIPVVVIVNKEIKQFMVVDVEESNKIDIKAEIRNIVIIYII